MNGEYELDELKRYLSLYEIEWTGATVMPFSDKYLIFYLNDEAWIVELHDGLTLFIDGEEVGSELEASQIIERIENGIDDE